MCASGTEIFKYFPKNLARRFLVVGQFKVSRPSGEFFTTFTKGTPPLNIPVKLGYSKVSA